MPITSPSRRTAGVGLLATVALGLTAGAVVPPASAATAAPALYNHQGYAYGTSVKVGSVVKSGPSAPVALGCTVGTGLHRSNTTAGVDLSPLLRTGTVGTTADTGSSPTSSRTSARTQGARLLGGLVYGSVIKAVSTTTAGGSGLAVSGAGTNFTGLTVAGTPVATKAAPNTKIKLPGVGYLILNEQSRTVTATAASLTVNALHLVVTTRNTLGAKVGTNLVVSHAVSGLDGPVAGILTGAAYSTRAQVAKTVKSGPSFRVMMPCLGTGGNVRSNTGAGITLRGLARTGTIRNTVQGTVTASTARGETTATVQNANVLAGIVTASLVKADATVVKTSSGITRSGNGSTFGTLKVKGHPGITGNVGPNTTVKLAGIGTLYLHRVITTPHGIEVRMIELQVTNPNAGPAVGTDLRIAVAKVAAS